MTNTAIDIPHPKRRGEWAELRFMSRASEHGLAVAKPWGESAAYDFAVEHNGHFLRVQVKCTRYRRWNSYRCSVAASGAPYAAQQLDFIAAYVIPADAWYIIPAALIVGKQDILLSPHREKSKFGRFKEAWHLLRADSTTCPWQDECRDRFSIEC
jgi:hypothetical protein